MRDGAAAADADGVARDDQGGGQLPPLELVGRGFDAAYSNAYPAGHLRICKAV